MNDGTPCACWSCDSQCGNDQEYCGPLAERAGLMLCQACRDQTAAFDVDRQGISIEAILGGGIRLGNAFDHRSTRYYLDMANARALRDRLDAAITEAMAGV